MFNYLQYFQNSIAFIYVLHHTMETLVIVQILDFRFLMDLHVSGSGESKKIQNQHGVRAFVKYLVC